jgi:ribosomal 30S subunit maturation factor RimM
MLRSIPSQFIFELGREVSEETEEDESYDDHDHISQDTPQFKANQLVRHNSFGLGRVKEFIEMGENSIVVVQFNSGQTKSLMIKYANLLKI